MRELVQSISDGELHYVDAPDGGSATSGVRVRVGSSLISSGTERSSNQLASSSLVSKARACPDLVRAVVERARADGVGSTVKAVRSRLSDVMPVGYSAAGWVETVGAHSDGFRPGDRVATAGSGHGEVQVTSSNLAALLPDDVSFEEGSFGAVASVGLHGLRLAEAGPGDKVLIVGLGLIGQLTARIAFAMGCDVAGTDVDPWKIDKARASGVTAVSSAEATDVINDWTRGNGVDAVLVTAATKSSEPMRSAAKLACDRATIVAVGDVGLDLDRRPLYEKELTVKVSRSYGAGRYDPVFEDLGIDYPVGYEPFTIKRNLETVVNLIASDRLEVRDLITHRFSFDDAIHAYDVFDGGEPYLGIVLEYDTAAEQPGSIELNPRSTSASATALSSGLIGAGRFAADVLVPSASEAGFGPWSSVASAEGVSAVKIGHRFDFERAVATASEVLDDDASVVFIASRHDSHAELTSSALSLGKHVFCEKPLAITEGELDAVVAAYNDSDGVLMAGFNRRWSPLIRQAVAHVGRSTSLHILYRVNAGALPDDHWLNDRRQGGRLLGEGCHFIDTCNAITDEVPRSVHAVSSGSDELLLDDDFTITLGYPSGSQAVIVYSSGSPRGAGKERIEVMRGDRSAEIDDFRSLTLRTATKTDTVKFKPADKGHKREFVVFRQAIEGAHDAAELAMTAVQTSRTAFAAVESLMTGTVIYPVW